MESKRSDGVGDAGGDVAEGCGEFGGSRREAETAHVRLPQEVLYVGGGGGLNRR